MLAFCLGLLPFNMAVAMDITGAGASFPYPIYAKWAGSYHKLSGHRINFQSIGSGGGQQQIIAGTVDFGASDDPMSAAELAKYNLLQFPAVIGTIVPIVNIKNIGPGDLNLTGELLADIFLGKVHRWNDPKIIAVNPDLNLPDKEIVVVHRADGSGTTFHWTNYLSQVSMQWRDTVGEGKAVKWPTGHGGKGNEGVSAYVSQLENSIGYVEYAFAHQNNMAWTKLQNNSSNFVSPDPDSFAATVENIDWQQLAKQNYTLNNMPGEHTWPITVATFILVPMHTDKPKRLQAVLDFFSWAWQDGKQMASNLDFVPLPNSLVQLIKQQWQQYLPVYKGVAQ